MAAGSAGTELLSWLGDKLPWSESVFVIVAITVDGARLEVAHAWFWTDDGGLWRRLSASANVAFGGRETGVVGVRGREKEEWGTEAAGDSKLTAGTASGGSILGIDDGVAV